MALYDARPPFAAIGGTVPPEFAALPTPCYLLDEAALTRNAEILGSLSRRTGCRVLLAQKAFSNYDLYPLLAPHLAGTEASGLFEARLGAEEMPDREVHVFCAAYRADEMNELLRYADRGYQPDGTLVPRGTPGAMVEDEDTAIVRVLQMAKQGTVQANDGSTVTLQADSVCIHGDGPKALAFVQKISTALPAAGVEVRTFTATTSGAT